MQCAVSRARAYSPPSRAKVLRLHRKHPGHCLGRVSVAASDQVLSPQPDQGYLFTGERWHHICIVRCEVVEIVEQWAESQRGVLHLPSSGRLVRGRGLRHDQLPDPLPTFGVYLLGSRPPDTPWPSEWIKWHDFWLPSDHSWFVTVLRSAWDRAPCDRVEIACGGGVGRTGTALACLAVLDGMSPDDAVSFVRGNYHARAIETPWQRRYVTRFQQSVAVDGA